MGRAIQHGDQQLRVHDKPVDPLDRRIVLLFRIAAVNLAAWPMGQLKFAGRRVQRHRQMVVLKGESSLFLPIGHRLGGGVLAGRRRLRGSQGDSGHNGRR